MRQLIVLAAVFVTVATAPAPAAEPNQPVRVPRGWYNPHDLLALVAGQIELRWAMPETLAGNALVGGEKDQPAMDLISDAARQWGLRCRFVPETGVLIIDADGGEQAKTLTAALGRGGAAAVEAAWELGWLRDASGVAALADALAGKDPAVALSAAKAVELLEKRVPLGRTDRVDPVEHGRVNLATAYRPRADLSGLLDSPYPSIRAAALRLMLAQGGAAAKTAEARTADDASDLVVQVRQQMLFPALAPAPEGPAGDRGETFPAVPEDARDACATMIGELPALEKNSDWEHMRRRARVIAHWARLGDPAATDALLELSATKHQAFWYPAYVHMHMAQVGEPRVVARLKEIFAARGADHGTLVRGLEKVAWGDGLLAYTRPFIDRQTVVYVTANKAGREAYDDILKRAATGDFAAIDALGAVGGARAVPVLTELLNNDSGTIVFRAAKALGQVGLAEAADALLRASESDVRVRRHAAMLFLGRIGGPEVQAKLLERVGDEDRLIAAAAADALAQIGTAEAAAAVAAFRTRDAGLPPLVYRPRNKRFGPDFPVNRWVDLDIRIEAHANYGEMGWNYDAANKLFFRYGGCSGYTNELTLFDLGTETFVQRRPNEELAGWGSRRPQRGCSGGREWDPYQKVAWIGQSIGGSAADLAISEYYIKGGDYAFSSYDLATDRFRSAPYLERYYGGPPKRYAYDWKNGLLYPVKFSPFKNEKPFWAVDTRTDPYRPDAWVDMTAEGDYPRFLGYDTAAVDQHTGTLVVYIPAGQDPETRQPRDQPQTWTFNPQTRQWRNMQPKAQPRGVHGAGFDYDPFGKVLLFQGGRKVSQYGGPDDSITWSYDLSTNTWTDLSPENGPGNPWVGAMAFDPEHNVLVLFHFRANKVMAYRHKPVEPGAAVQW